MAKLVFNESTPREQYEELFKLREGELFKVEAADYETVMERIEECKPTDREFEVFPVNPGTETYTMVGPDHLVITKNQPIVNG